MHDINGTEYKYKIYGLKVLSQIKIPELISDKEYKNEDYNIVIKYGVVPRVVSNAKVQNNSIKISKKVFYFYIKNVGHYYVANGNKIIVEPEINCNESELKVYLLGTAFGILLTQRNIIAIHGGSIVINGQAIIVTGKAGVGKSTLTSALRSEGYKFLADDVSALGRNEKNEIIVQPTYPQAKLCRDAMEDMGYNPKNYRITDPSRDKYAIPLLECFLDFPVMLGAIYEIETGDTCSVEITEIFGVEKVKLILRSIYRIEISRYLGFTPEYFKQCVEIAKYIPIYRITRPRDGFTLEEQINLIKNSLRVINKNII
jgi:hypothetical protein